MKWSSTMWIVFTGFTLLTVVNGLEIKEILPDNLRECYNDTKITTRDNLLPFTVTTLISLIRKIEDSFTNDMRVLSSAISQRYRYDGVQRNLDIDWSDVVIPFSPVGTEFKLFKVLFEKLMPSTQTIPNNTLSYKERCTLHYMLSTTIDPTVDDCSKINQYSNYNQWGGIRFPRAAANLDPDAEVFDPHAGPSDYGRQSSNFQQYDTGSHCPIESGVIFNKYGTVSAGMVLAGIAAGLQHENVNVRNLLLVSPRLRRPLPTGGRQPSYDRPPYDRPPYSRPSQPAYGGRISFNQQQPGGGSGYQPGGGGSGYQPGGGGGFGGGYGGDTIDNRYAATLSGLLAEVSLLLGPSVGHNSRTGIGMTGGWNDTAIPKYYFVKDYIKNGLTDAKLRGGIDGLLLSKEVTKWTGSGSLKLSQVLGMYYSDRGLFGTNIRACSRREHVDELSQDSELKDSAYGFALLLQNSLPDSGTIASQGIYDYVHTFTDNAMAYIGTSMSEKCPTDTRTPATTYTPTPAVDLHIVIDATYDYRDISKIITYIVDNVEVNKYSSNISLINGYEGKVIVDSVQSPLEVYGNFTFENYTSVSKGFDFDKLLSGLRLRFQSRMRFDQTSMSGGGIGRVILFIPQASANVNNKDYLRDKVQQFKVKVPDAKFLFLASGTKDKFSPFVEDPNKDIFLISVFTDIAQTLDPVIKRIAETPRRLINPNCGPYWSGSWYSPITVKGFLQKPEVNYYRIHPNYFYSDANARITFKNDDGSQTLTVCTSRQPIVANTTQNSVRQDSMTCKQLTGRNSLDYWIKSGDCPNSFATSCDPHYFSISTDNALNAAITVSCPDADCKYPDMIKYSVEHQGLTCYSGASNIFGIPILVLILYSITLLR